MLLGGIMPIVTATRFQARRFVMLPFLTASLRAAWQARRSAGYLGGVLLKDRRRAYWTVTVWEDEAAVKAYRDSGFHGGVMRRLGDWADNFAMASWSSEEPTRPAWDVVHERLQEGRRINLPGRPKLETVPRPMTLLQIPVPGRR